MVRSLCGFFFQAEDGIRDLVRSRGLGDVYKRQEYVVAGTRFSVPPDDANGDVPIDTYKQNFKGNVSFIKVDSVSGNMKIAFQIRTPGVNFDLSHAGKGNSHGWFFFSCYNSEPVSYTHLTLPTSDLV